MTMTKIILNSIKFYSQDISNPEVQFHAEINLWKNNWDNIKTDVPQNVVVAFAYYDDFFLNIKILL